MAPWRQRTSLGSPPRCQFQWRSVIGIPGDGRAEACRLATVPVLPWAARQRVGALQLRFAAPPWSDGRRQAREKFP
eukprot:12007616-Alexandrium_andersonii.AAC.1